MLTILNSISTLNGENALSSTSANLQKTLTQLSTGLRVNSGADDAAGLSIANVLQANVAALTQSNSNAADGIGMLQTKFAKTLLPELHRRDIHRHRFKWIAVVLPFPSLVTGIAQYPFPDGHDQAAILGHGDEAVGGESDPVPCDSTAAVPPGRSLIRCECPLGADIPGRVGSS